LVAFAELFLKRKPVVSGFEDMTAVGLRSGAKKSLRASGSSVALRLPKRVSLAQVLALLEVARAA
jgi:hypothetical protein